MDFRFNRLPTWWVNGFDSILKNEFTSHGKYLGRNISALKCYLAIISKVIFETGISEISYSEIEDIGGISRPMIKKGLDHLVNCKLISISKIEKTNKYHVNLKGNCRLSINDTVDEYDKWAKLPRYIIQKNLKHLSSRGEISLLSLKIYIYLLSIRNNQSNEVSATYTKITDSLGIQRAKIKKSLSNLVVLELISITQSESNGDFRGHNIFIIKGVKKDKYFLTANSNLP